MITVIGGVNGAGKSSVLGSFIRSLNGDYFNPDEVARAMLEAGNAVDTAQANIQAWKRGFDLLRAAISAGGDYTFETTLGGNSICDALLDAINKGNAVRILFCGLSSPELHIARVEARVERGGHAIPENKIRERWQSSRANLMALIEAGAEVRVIDNSAERLDHAENDSRNAEAATVNPVCLFHVKANEFVQLPIADMPDWAKPIAVAAMKRCEPLR